MLLVFLVVVGAFAIYVLNPEERRHYARIALDVSGRAWIVVRRHYAETDPYGRVLRERTAWPVVTCLVAAANVIVFAGMLFGAGALADPDTLLGWGASLGTRTTNGEWWRLATMVVVHTGLVHLVVCTVALVQAGEIVERIVGHVVFFVVYLGAGVLAGLAQTSASPLVVTAGASGAVMGAYGLMLASVAAAAIQGSPLRPPLKVLARLAPVSGLFLLYTYAAGLLTSGAALAALATGVAGGIALAKGLGDAKPPVPRVAAVAATALGVVVACAVPLRGLTDVRPDIAAVLSVEERTAAVYAAAVDRFRKGRIGAAALREVVEGGVMPELDASVQRLEALTSVLPEHQALVDGAGEYLRLRQASWQVRADALRASSMDGLRRADDIERSALDLLRDLNALTSR